MPPIVNLIISLKRLLFNNAKEIVKYAIFIFSVITFGIYILFFWVYNPFGDLFDFSIRANLYSYFLCIYRLFAMPCGLNTIVFPRLVGEKCEIGAGLAFISSILSLITLPLLVQIFA